jgi:hypothetical protein
VRRRAPFFLYLVAIVALAAYLAVFGWVRAWSSVYVPTMYPPFADMRLIQGAVISVERGLNPRVSNVGDHWRRPFNYPMLWVAIGKALNFTNESRFILICSALLLSFVGICAYLIFTLPSFGLLASLISTATLLGIERANTDLVVFCLLVPAALWLPKRWSPIPILLATLLKLYPVFALSALFVHRKFRIFGYLWGQLGAIRAVTPVSCTLSYGLPSVAACFYEHGLSLWQFIIVLALTGATLLGLARYFHRAEMAHPRQECTFHLMLVGAAIYVGTFIFSANFDYRLIFLIFCIPFLERQPFPFAGALIVAILLAMNELLLTYWFGLNGLIVVGLAKLAIFTVLSAYLMALVAATLALPRARRKMVGAAAAPD